MSGALAIREAEPAQPPASRPQITVSVRYFAGSGANYDSHVLYNPKPVDLARALCDATLIYPEQFEVHAYQDRPFICVTRRSDGAGVAMIEATPATRIDKALIEAFIWLEQERWCPAPPLHELIAKANALRARNFSRQPRTAEHMPLAHDEAEGEA